MSFSGSSKPSICEMVLAAPTPALSYSAWPLMEAGVAAHLGRCPTLDGPGVARGGPLASLGGSAQSSKAGRLTLSLGPGISFAAILYLLAAYSSLSDASKSSLAISVVTLVHEVSPGSLMFVKRVPSKLSNFTCLLVPSLCLALNLVPNLDNRRNVSLSSGGRQWPHHGLSQGLLHL